MESQEFENPYSKGDNKQNEETAYRMRKSLTSHSTEIYSYNLLWKVQKVNPKVQSHLVKQLIVSKRRNISNQ